MPTPGVDTRYVQQSQLQNIIDAQTKELKLYFAAQITEQLKPLNEEISSLKSELKCRNEELDKLKTEYAAVKSSNESLEVRVVKMEKFQSAALESFKALEEKLEDRTNLQLRQTIVIKGIPEKANEKWADTRNILAKSISKTYDMEYKRAYSLFERVHRGGGNGFQDKKKGKRDIYALCSHWDDSEFLVTKSYDVNKSKPKKDRFHIGYKYGPITTARRGEALKKRKEVLANKEYRNAYVKFPAVLMARKDGEENYQQIADFSNTCVSKLPVMAGD